MVGNDVVHQVVDRVDHVTEGTVDTGHPAEASQESRSSVCSIWISASTLFIARQTRSDLLRCKCSHPLSQDRLIQIPLYFMLQYCSLGYRWARINNPAVLLVYSSGRPRPIVKQVAIRELSQRLGRGCEVFSRTSRLTAILKFPSGSSVSSRSR